MMMMMMNVALNLPIRRMENVLRKEGRKMFWHCMLFVLSLNSVMVGVCALMQHRRILSSVVEEECREFYIYHIR